MEIREEDYLEHYGILRKSGRYPWGSGGDYGTGPNRTVPERSRTFLDWIKHLFNRGLTEAQVAKGVGLSVADLRATKSIALNALKQENISQAQALKEKGMATTAIGRKMGVPEATVRSWLRPGEKDKNDQLMAIANDLRQTVREKGWLDVGLGTERWLGVARTRFEVALAILKSEGFQVHRVKIDQAATSHQTDTKVLVPPGVSWKDVINNQDKIKSYTSYSEDGGRTILGILPPKPLSSKRIAINYAEDGGSENDGVIWVRPGVEDVSLGGNNYAQVRVNVDGSHYLKGMAMYKDDLPPGVDIVFNTNKSKTDPKVLEQGKLGAMKEMNKLEDGSVDMDNPFGAVLRRQIGIKGDDDKVKELTSTMNLVNEQGDWEKWSKSLSSQFLSKQQPSLAKDQLDMTYERRKLELDEIKSLTNPTVRQHLLEKYADSVDSAAVHLKAYKLPRQATHVILPIGSMKPNEIFAPNYDNGDTVVLVRFPHGGIFEIPELTVNNRQREARKLIGPDAPDAVGIHPDVAKRLSGADFDGDTVLVIPNRAGAIKTAAALEGLKDFDPQRAYPGYEGMPVMKNTQTEMGKISNLITDMTIHGADADELARAVRHSMVVIDAEKHKLNYKLSAERNGILQLKKKYQDPDNVGKYGASTIISRAKSRLDVPERKKRPAKDGGFVDRETGEKVYVPTNREFVNKKGEVVRYTTRTTKLAEAKDARTLSSGTKIETIYADHSNRLKALANEARKEAVNTKPALISPSAKKHYAKEVDSLKAKLDLAFRNKPLERQAQVLAKAAVSTKKAANPELASDKDELKKVNRMALVEARNRTGATKQQIKITPSEWAAIQAGAITTKTLKDILDNADLEEIKKLATPKAKLLMTSSKITRARSMAARGYTQAEIAQALGVSLTTLKTSL